jgi:hypothetical protein
MDTAELIAELEKTASSLEELANTPEGVESATDYLSGLLDKIGQK